MASPQEAVKLRKELRRHLKRMEGLQSRCLALVCDGDIRWVDRQTAHQRLQLLLRETESAETQLTRVDDALEGSR